MRLKLHLDQVAKLAQTTGDWLDSVKESNLLQASLQNFFQNLLSVPIFEENREMFLEEVQAKFQCKIENLKSLKMRDPSPKDSKF